MGGWGDGGDIWIDDDLSVEKSLLRNMKIFLVCTYSVNGIRTFDIYRQAQGQQYWHIDNLKHPKLIPKVHPVSMHTLVKSFPCHNITILPKLYHTIILKYICHKLCYRYTEVQCTISCECTLVNSSPNRPLLLRSLHCIILHYITLHYIALQLLTFVWTRSRPTLCWGIGTPPCN